MKKEDFQVFKNNNVIYLDSAATTQRPKQVIDSLIDAYENKNANAHRAGYELSIKATEGIEEARETFAKFIGANKNEIIFTKNTTEALNNLVRSIDITSQDDILVTDMEHHSNFVPWQQRAKEENASFRSVPINKETNELDFNINLIQDNTKVFSFTGMSNITGYIPDVKKIIEDVRKKNSKTIIIFDACQLAPHKNLNVVDLDVDFLVFSVHKMYGPFSVGVLYGKYALLEKLKPFLYGGSMIGKVTKLKTTWANIPHRFEAGTMDSSSIIAAKTSVEYLTNISIEKIEEHENKLIDKLKNGLNKIDGLKILGHTNKNYGPLLSFYVEGVDSSDIAIMLGSKNIAVRAGNHCAEPFIKAMGLLGTVRVSFGVYNTEEDVEKFIVELKKVIETLRR